MTVRGKGFPTMAVQTSPKKDSLRVALLVVLVSWLVLGSIGVLLWFAIKAATGQFRNRYASIEIAPDKVMWVHFKRTRLRMASTADGLDGANWVEPEESEWGYLQFPPIALPLQGERPHAWQKIEVAFDWCSNDCYVEWWLTREDENGVEWTYIGEEEVRTGKSPAATSSIRIPEQDNAKLEVETQTRIEAGEPEVGVALTLTLRRLELIDVQKEGESVQGHVRVLDSSGEVVGKEAGTLEDLGLLWGEPYYSVRVANQGDYLCEGTIDAGPLGGLIKAQAQIGRDDWSRAAD